MCSDHFSLFYDIDSNIIKSKLTVSGNEQMLANNPYSGKMKPAINVDWDLVGDYERKTFVKSLSNKLKSIKVLNCALQCGNIYYLKLYECTCTHEQFILLIKMLLVCPY